MDKLAPSEWGLAPWTRKETEALETIAIIRSKLSDAADALRQQSEDIQARVDSLDADLEDRYHVPVEELLAL